MSVFLLFKEWTVPSLASRRIENECVNCPSCIHRRWSKRCLGAALRAPGCGVASLDLSRKREIQLVISSISPRSYTDGIGLVVLLVEGAGNNPAIWSPLAMPFLLLTIRLVQCHHQSLAHAAGSVAHCTPHDCGLRDAYTEGICRGMRSRD